MSTCPLDLPQLVEEYFAESRNHLLELAAFFDRLDRAHNGGNPDDDFRIAALKRAAALLLQGGPQTTSSRVKRMAMLLSDLTDDPRDGYDRKAAWGAPAAQNGNNGTGD